MTISNEPYIRKAVEGALADFNDQAGPGNNNDRFFALACRLLELAHAAPDVYSAADAERDACGAARGKGHDEPSIAATWRSAERTTAGKAATIPAPAYQNGQHAPSAGGYADLAAYAASKHLPAEVFERAGWADAALYEFTYQDRQGRQQVGHTDEERLVYTRRRRAIRIETDSEPRYRLIDEDRPKPKYWHKAGAHVDASKVWYRLGEALALAAHVGYLALVNGEASVVVGQHFGVPALCEAGGGEKPTPDHLLQLLRAVWPGPILIALDCDGKGQKAAAKKVAQYRAAGWSDARAVDLNLGAGEDVADFCRLHTTDAAQRLPLLADLAGTAPAAPAAGQPAPRTQSQNIIAELARLGYIFRLNLCTDTVEMNGEPLDDIRVAEMRTKLRDLGWKRFGAVEDAYTAHAAANAYHPIKDYLTSLPPWDGLDRLAQLVACFQSDDPPVTYQDGRRVGLVGVYCVRWLVGCVAKVFEGAQNGMLVLAGPQNLGKSHLARWLCPLPAYFLESAINPNDKDTQVRAMHTWIWEVSELDATTRKADVSALKAFITQGTISVRKSYGRYDTTKPALASFIGTVNDGSGFLADETGNRRFYVLSLKGLNWAYTQIDRDQLWAQVLHRYRAGESWRLSPEESAHQTEQNRRYYAETPLHDYVRRYFIVTRDPSHRMTAADIVDELKRREIPLALTDHQLAIALNRVAASLGLEKVRDATGRYYVGIMPKL